jgi:hypothetical protein
MADTGAMSDAETAHSTDPAAHDDTSHHEPAGEPLGPVDVAKWGYAIAGGAVGVLVVVVLVVASAG